MSSPRATDPACRAGIDTTAVLVDGCAVNRFALVNVDPVRELESGTFQLTITPALEAEYRAALDHLFVPPYVKALLRKLLAHCEPYAAANSDRLPVMTDTQLAALARAALVITDDAKLYRRWSDECFGLVAWPDVEAHLKAGGGLRDMLRARVSRLRAG